MRGGVGAAVTRELWVDLSMLGARTTGVQVYSVHMARRLEETFECRILAPRYLRKLFANAVEVPDPISIRGNPLCRRRWSAHWRKLVPGPDCLVYAPHMKGIFPHANQIVTIHDLIHHHHPTRNFLENGYNRYMLPAQVHRMRAIFTVSGTVKNELCEFYGLSREQVRVVPNGLDPEKWHPGNAALRPGEPYLLVVSANRPYKNTVELLDQHRLWSAAYRLKIVSSKARYGSVIRSRVSALGLEGRVDFVDDVDEDTLIEMYRCCAATVYPSLAEGFGRPALEAMSVGRPVILSDIPVHREIFGDAAILITPGDTRSWETAFAVLNDSRAVEEKVVKGLRIAERHTWLKCGDRLIDALMSVVPELELLQKSAPGRHDARDSGPAE